MYQIFSDTLRRSLTFSTILRHSPTLANFHLISLFSIIIPSLFCLSAIFVIFHIFLFIHDFLFILHLSMYICPSIRLMFIFPYLDLFLVKFPLTYFLAPAPVP